ncbi:MARVEL domain-containing protein 1-like [Limulus polyphemus]|uniref:MARVEL domain-containing protein 1-like n=1 Tax=Limulus polyphemus TaxID=6850 RepID=A0ABM1BS71_LIMPO|nr:MARVEL domain-containing protein 1-like [Limulus polyphemus]XP_022255903.1 MARVEL domain-containing protein 1-like [Limulus polyphemus]XP_022255904.1 MARVEL domain-containing protein 1-like [Limulus polyphemus]
MATDFSATHTSTTVTSSTTKVSPIIRFDKSYIRTVPGILKVVQVVINLIGFICAQVALCSLCSESNWFSFVSMTAFWVTLILLIFYLFHVIEKTHIIPWLLVELVYCGVWTIFYLIAALVVSVNGRYDNAWAAAGFFGFVAMLLYGTDTFLKYKAWRTGEIAQGERTVTVTTSQTTSPTSPTYPAY